MRDYSRHAEPILEEVTFARRDKRAIEVEVLRLEELLERPMGHDLTKPQRVHFHAIILVEGGHSLHSVDFEQFPAEPGDLMIIPHRHVQAFSSERKLQGSMIVFTPAFIDGCSLEIRQLENAWRVLLCAAPHIRLGDNSFSLVRRLLDALAKHSRVPAERFPDEAIATAFSLLIFTLAGLPETGASAEAQRPRDALEARFLACLEEHFKSEHMASFYAGALHVSLRTLDRRLVAVRSQTTRRAIASRLILEAKRLLTRRDIRVKSIAYELGFSDPHNFTRFFRSQTGNSPQAFRRMLDDAP